MRLTFLKYTTSGDHSWLYYLDPCMVIAIAVVAMWFIAKAAFSVFFMLRKVFGIRLTQGKIFWPIVGLYAVYMMTNLARDQKTTQAGFDNKPVFSNVAFRIGVGMSRIVNQDIAIHFDSPSLPSWMPTAPIIAIEAFPASGLFMLPLFPYLPTTRAIHVLVLHIPQSNTHDGLMEGLL